MSDNNFDIIITRVYDNNHYIGCGEGIIINHEVFKKLLFDMDFYTEYTGRKHKTEFGEIYLTSVCVSDRTVEFHICDELKIPEEIYSIIVRPGMG